ncbi:MAG: carboxylesterase family protein [Deltaproteobacteria bacterium]|nr:carboxylesterase family protein [Deltaproteobacteria bacterium]
MGYASKMRIVVIAFLLLLVQTGCEQNSKPQPPRQDSGVIKIDNGPIARQANGIYKGLPYAAPPVGELRWKPPQPVKEWTEVRKFKQFGPVCPQPDHDGQMSEDCLYLNIWTPAKSTTEKLPVMVWIHGGAFVAGSGSDEIYDGEALAKKGVVVVTINYRLGVLGFLAHPLLSQESPDKISGNYGILDQVAALKWVQRNIEQFGGDPGKVTIFGESAGGTSVVLLLVNPEAKGLFRSAIAQSPAIVGMLRPLRQGQLNVTPAETVGNKLSEQLEANESENILTSLRQTPWDEIADAAKDLEEKYGVEIARVVFGPTLDEKIIPDHPVKLLDAGKYHQVPLVVGICKNESTIFLPSFGPSPTPEDYQKYLKASFGEKADEVQKLLPVVNKAEVWGRLDRLMSAKWFGAAVNYLARTRSGDNAPHWLYYFSHQAPPEATMILAADTTREAVPIEKLGTVHGSELFYVFGFTESFLDFEQSDLDLSDKMMTYWANFARTGNPNGENLPFWPVYPSAKAGAYLEFGQSIAAKSGLEPSLYPLIEGTWFKLAY